MSKPVKKARRTNHYENSEGWAVSYSDLLMVLMSFFIIYFNLNDVGKNDHIQKLAFKLMNSDVLKDQNFVVNPERKIATKDIGESLNISFNNSKKIEKPIYKEFIIDLPPNIYDIGKYDLSQSVVQKLESVFKLLEEHKEKLDVYFIGHTDSLKFKENKEVINSNLILSSMRAARAVEFAIKKGFDENQVFVQGLKARPRDTRSLSIRLVSR